MDEYLLFDYTHYNTSYYEQTWSQNYVRHLIRQDTAMFRVSLSIKAYIQNNLTENSQLLFTFNNAECVLDPLTPDAPNNTPLPTHVKPHLDNEWNTHYYETLEFVVNPDMYDTRAQFSVNTVFPISRLNRLETAMTITTFVNRPTHPKNQL